MAEYRFREHPSNTGGLGAQVIGEALADIEDRHGVINPNTVVDESRPENAPLHPVFEWRDEIAAENWRVEQARRVVRCVEVVIDKRHDSTQVAQIAYVNIPSQKGYINQARVGRSVELYREAEALFMDRLAAAQRQLDKIQQLSPFDRRPRMAKAAEHLKKAKELVSAGRGT